VGWAKASEIVSILPVTTMALKIGLSFTFTSRAAQTSYNFLLWNSDCDIGKKCCNKKCNPKLGGMVDCMIKQQHSYPFMAAELNQTIQECPMDIDECELENSGKRKMHDLKEGEEEVFIKALSLPKKNTQKSNQA
jgi:hypothetical protein